MQKHRMIIAIFILLLGILVLVSCGTSNEDILDSGEKTDQAAQQAENNQDTEQEEQAADQQAEKPADEAGQDEEKRAEEEIQEETEVNTDNITINTQSSIRIEGSKTIYLDPFKRTETPHDADIIFITHDHYDHLDEPSFRNVANEDSVIVCPKSMLTEVVRMNARERTDNADGDIIGMTAGDTAEVAEGITVKAVPAYNLNKNFHPKSNGWLGYIITMDGVRYYAAGDTDALPELESVECDIAFVPVGGTYTETAAEAAGLVNKIHPAYAIPIHYGTIVGRSADADTFGAALDEDIKMVKKVEDAK